MSTLRTHTIRLAYSRPDLRPHLLSILSRTAKDDALDLDPKAILEALAEVSKDPEKYGVTDTDALDELSKHVKSLLGQPSEGKGEGSKKKAGAIAKALKLAAAGFDAVGAAIKAGRHVSGKFPKLQKTYDAVLKNTLAVAYSAAALGTAAALSTIAPDHPIAKHAADYDRAVETASEHLPLLEKMRKKTLHVVESMSDDEVGVSIGMMQKAVKAVTGAKALPAVSDETIEASVKMHNTLQDLFGHFTAKKVQHGKPKSEGGSEGKRTYQQYAEEKKQKGEKPMAKDQWEARFGPAASA